MQERSIEKPYEHAAFRTEAETRRKHKWWVIGYYWISVEFCLLIDDFAY